MGHYDDQREAWEPKKVDPIAQEKDAVDDLSQAQKRRLLEKNKQGYSGFNTVECTQQHLSNLLHASVVKGNVVDVANYCAFLYYRGESILLPEKEA